MVFTALRNRNCVTDGRHIDIYTDGGCIGNPGPGGFGVVLRYGPHRRELSGGFRRTTNNRMEILATLTALRALKEPCRVTLRSDSQYLVRAMTEEWPRRWKAHGWRRTARDPASNPDLWEALLDASEKHEVEWLWVHGHAGDADNEICDRLAQRAARGQNLPPDQGYKSSTS